MRNLRLLLPFIIAMGVVSPARAQWSLTRIADTTTQAPGGGVFGANGNRPFSMACHGQNGQLAFLAIRPSVGLGVFQGTAGSLVRIADFTTPVPGAPGAIFNEFGSVSFDGGPTTFLGRSSLAGSGIYSSSGGPLQALVDRTTPVPGGSGLFEGVGDVYRSGNAVTFLGGQGESFLGWYRWTTAGINPVVTLSTPIPGGVGTFTTWGRQALTADRFVFSARNDTTRGVYSRDPSGTGPISVLADTNTIVPGTSTPFAGFTVVAAEGASTAFLGGPAGNGGVWAHLNNQLIKVADLATPGAGGEQFTAFESLSISGNSVAFLVNTNVGRQIYVWRNGDLSRVAKSGDVINGISVSELQLTTQSLRGDTVAFTFNSPLGLPQEPNFGGVYTATYIPAPGAAVVMAAAGVWAGRRRRGMRLACGSTD